MRTIFDVKGMPGDNCENRIKTALQKFPAMGGAESEEGGPKMPCGERKMILRHRWHAM